MLAALLLSLTVSLSSADIKSDHEVTSLPGLEWQPYFKHYAGRLNISETKSLSYWLIESQNDKDKDPLLLWMNGGPGCSSFFGLLQEHGPFLLSEEKDDLKLHKNPNAWNNFANVVYLETPAGSGFSLNTNYSVSQLNDNVTAEDNLNFLHQFLEAYPEYKGRDFYITGESYGGCLVPTFANHVLLAKEKIELNFKGIAMGNAVTDNQWSNYKEVSLALHGASLTLPVLGQWMREFCPSGFDNLCKGGQVSKKTVKLGEIYANMMSNVNKDHFINAYDINRPCNGIDNLGKYLNQPEVQKALHLAVDGTAVKWQECNDGIYHHYNVCKDITDDVKNIQENNLKILYFYGETDTVCPFIIGDLFTHKIGKNPKTAPWFFDDLYAGTRTTFDGNLTYTTIADCGHMAAAWKPKQTARAVHHFINDISDWNN
uniref:Carboxypeptidase n=1 Tax=Bursaphelenchus xylophilus TaxID=6326 RepID=A0A1I7SXB9_BURXY